jgi:hypothetical protein
MLKFKTIPWEIAELTSMPLHGTALIESEESFLKRHSER